MAREKFHPGFRLAGIVFLLFCFSGFQSCQELKFMNSGKTATTTIKKITESTSRRGVLTGYTLSYVFKNENANKNVTGTSNIGLDEIDAYTVGQEITIEYIGGVTFTSRLAGTANMVMPIVFITMSVLMIGIVVYILRMKPS